MKKFFCAIAVFIAFVGVTCKVTAQNVDEKSAQKLAAYYMASQTGAKNLVAQDLTLVYQIDNTLQQIPAIYVFNVSNQGFVAVAGNECVSPIIAYSTSGNFDPENIAPAFQWWLSEQSQPIVYAQNNNIEPLQAVSMEWDNLKNRALPYSNSSKAITQLLSSQWDQGSPFNNQCPIISNTRCPVGCVATALSQILYYWKYPRVGEGISSFYSNSTGQTLSVNHGETYYNYDVMRNTMTYVSPNNSKEAVATLCYHVGVSVEMDYGVNGSGVPMEMIGQRTTASLKNHFKYPTTVKYSSRQWFSRNDSLFVDSCRNEITQRSTPVFYTGFDASSSGRDAGHAFVMDGYNSINGYFHFNWGWGGSDDAWCNLYTSQLRGGGYTFSSSHRVVFGIRPPQDSILAVNEQHSVELSDAYPNPAVRGSIITIPYSIDNANGAIMTISSVDGRMIEKHNLYAEQGVVTIDLSTYQAGVYIYTVNGVSKKFVVR